MRGEKTALNSPPPSRINPPVLARVCSAAVNGIEAYPIEVEVNAGYGDTIIVVNKSPKPVSLLSLRPLSSIAL